MTDAEYEEQQNRVRPLLDKWIKGLGLLDWWDIDIIYDREVATVEEREKRSGNWETTFRCNVDWRYAEASIRVYCPTIADINDECLERAVVHELGHIFLNETRQDEKDWLDHEERVATMLAKAFIQLRDSLKEDAVAVSGE